MSIKQVALLVARELRKNQTKAEKLFWTRIRNKQFRGYKFLRQHPVFYEWYRKEKFFIADFYCRELKLIVEIDGGIHEQQKDYDEIRSELLETQRDLKVIRFSNEQVMTDVEGVLLEMERYI